MHHVVELLGHHRGGEQLGFQLRLVLAEGMLVDGARRVAGLLQHVDQAFMDLGLPVAFADHIDGVDRFAGLLLDRAAVDAVDHRPQQRIARQHEHRRHQGLGDQVGAGAGANRCGAPERGRGVQADHIGALLHDGAGAEKAHARHDIGGHMHRAVVAAQALGHVDKHRRRHRHQCIGAQAGRALAPLTLQTDQAAQHKGRCDADEGVEQGGQIEVGQGLHARSIAEAASGRLRDTDGGLTGPCRRQRGGSRKLSGARHSRVRIAA
mmetsp:Transcript_6617/g.27509  ORF Transcript_6617/g.27509 Transcript_6617/m.27509 type:complete len:265 (+) Transcript_6617:395-1189(+)